MYYFIKYRLRGKLPFDDNIPEVIFQKTMKGEYAMEDEFWKNVSPQAKDLIKNMLNVDPLKRFNLK
jgi:hypothetical protein